MLTFDTDSAVVGIDNRCTACMSYDRSDFVGELRKTTSAIRGFEGTRVYDVYIGTIQWPFTTDQGDIDIVEIPNSCYVPEAKHRLISPQHWLQQLEKQYPNASQEPGCYTTAHKCILSWGEYTKTVYPNAQNVFDVYLADGFEAYEAFCVEHGVDTYDQDIAPDSLAFCCNVCKRDDCACTQGHKTATIIPAETWNR